jgi:membrane protease subunit (stomatin/prohibitin family)
MGLIKTVIDSVGAQGKAAGVNMFNNILGSAQTTVADQYLEYFYSDAITGDMLAVKGKNRLTKGNNKGSDNIISNGSIIEVNAGQAALIIDDGKVAEFCAEPGQYRYDQSSEPSIFYGNLGENILNTFKEIGKRFAFGGEISKTQRVYYITINEVRNNLWGTSNPIPFFISDQVTGFQGDISLIANGEYTFHISDPIRFYSFIAANFSGDSYSKKDLQSIMRSDFMTALQPALGALSDYGVGIRYSAITTKTPILVEKLNEQLSDKWGKLRGIEVLDVTFNSLKATEEDEKRIKQFQDTAVYTNDQMKAARMTTAYANAMESAASNESTGPMMAFAGLNMAQNAAGGMTNNLFGMAQQAQGSPAPGASVVAAAAVNGWKCSCGKDGNTGKFCAECGAKKPDNAGWTCSCGAVNQGKFCAECGAKKPEGAPLYKCDKCGWEPDDPMNPPKFCPECGDVFDDNDKV